MLDYAALFSYGDSILFKNTVSSCYFGLNRVFSNRVVPLLGTKKSIFKNENRGRHLPDPGQLRDSSFMETSPLVTGDFSQKWERGFS